MIKNEYLRYLKSKSTAAIILILIVIGTCSFYMSLSDKHMFQGQLMSGSNDINYKVLNDLVERFTGVKFIFDFWFLSDFFDLFVMILFLWIGIFLAVIPLIQKENGFGNLIVSKMNYKKYIKSVLAAQSLYICTVILCSTAVLAIIAMMIGGFGFKSVLIGTTELGLFGATVAALIQISVITLFTVLINGMCLLSNRWIKNKYLLQIFPIAVFILIPMVLGNTLGNLSALFAHFISVFIPFNLLNGVYSVVLFDYNTMTVLSQLLPLIIYTVLFIVMLKNNVRKFSEDYI